MVKNEDLVQKVDGLIDYVEKDRFTYSRQWYINKAFYENNHFVMWNRFTRTIDRVAPSPGTVLRCIPKARRQIEAVNNMILASEIRWTVIPDGNDKDGDQVATRVNQFLQEKWDQWGVRSQLDELVLNSLLYNAAYIVTGFDAQKGDIVIDVKDAFDVYHPTYVQDLEDSPFIIVTYLKNVMDLKNNPKYKNTDKMVPDKKKAQSEYKDLRYNDKFGNQNSTYEESQTVILKRAYFKIKEKEGTYIKVITTAGGQLLLNERYEANQYPIVIYKPMPGEIFQPSWIERYISMNKSLDVFVSQIENFMNLMVRGRWAKRRGNNITRRTNQDGEEIEYDTEPPQLLEIPTMPNFPFLHMGNLEKWLQEQGVSTVSMGAQPKGIRAYKAIESLKQSDFANLRVPVANLKDTLQRLTEKILDLASQYYLDPQIIYRTDKDQADNFQVIGQQGASLDINQPMMQSANPPTVIKKSFRVKAQVDSGLSYTEEGKRDTLWQLFQGGVIDQRTLMEGYKMSNITDILEQVQYEASIPMTETADFAHMPDEMKKIILEYLNDPAVKQANPIIQGEKIRDRRKNARKSFKKG